MAIQEPAHIKGVLPPSFRAWSQLLRRIEKSIKEDRLKPGPDGVVIWFESHPAGLRQGYEFTVNEIKARTYEELIKGVSGLINAVDTAFESGPLDRAHALEELYRFFKYQYLKE